MPQNAAGWRIEPPVSGPGAPHTQAGPDRRRRPARRTARHQLLLRTAPAPWRYDRIETRRFIRRAHGELIVVELAEEHRTVAPQIGGDGGLIGGNEIFQNARASRGADASGAI